MLFNVYKKFDVIIIGAGGAGMRTALQLSKSKIKVALFSKVFPTRSHTVSAQGGITAALGNIDNDSWKWHMYDTVKGSDYIGDQNCIEYLCRNASNAVYELEHMGLPFSRTKNGKIYQRPFGGQTKNFGREQATRTCAAEDRTGHALLHVLYQQNLKEKTCIFSEWYVIDLVKDMSNCVVGITAICIETGEICFIQSRVCVIATGGAGHIYQSTTNAYINTGDGLGMVLRAGFPLQDMEMWQFHPTGILGSGVLITEGCRGEGGYLINRYGERFMENYAPMVKDLASRDVVSRAIAKEINCGRGFIDHSNNEGVGYVKLKIDHLGFDLIRSRLPGIRELSIKFASVDPVYNAIPVVPTCHYSMGGIPTNIYGQVLTQKDNIDNIVEGLYAVGECACVSVHGANRLGGNSLLDLIVFGKAVGLHIESMWKLKTIPSLDKFISNDDITNSLSRYLKWENKKDKDGENPYLIYKEMKRIMQDNFGVFRTGKLMQLGIDKLKFLKERLNHAILLDKSKVFNTERIFVLELDNLMEVAFATAKSALIRTESRGAHFREDFPKRDDVNWMKHTLFFKKNETVSFRSVNVDTKFIKSFSPKERVY
ncbi:succinate dehydrogenase flavoprotein subunit [Candidatus Legionella polyplacis]|uniref:succinate dehydrogenase flavoprotein subunit n=1 Tax=Candidatus Legionella polyplacis TaxID=2005262 RepID=UPI000C1E5DC1|nr:succinate dehydrogenase flavoprotein subunit [Candidatus Legionella polyplacis]ATW01909.1 succinate dehydrogenase flavoprotein subunit [Candidatus Legionella polyplacis]